MKVLRKGDKGKLVKQWQLFLHGQGFSFTTARDGVFGPETESLTMAFQKAHDLKDDGIVGNATFGAAMQLGFEAVDFTGEPEAAYPAEPNFDPIVGTAGRQALFGPLKYVAGGSGFGKESITITNDFESKKIVRVEIPELVGINGAPSNGRVRFHAAAAAQFQGLWTAWGRSGLVKAVLSWDGSFAPRFIRCSTSSLSNHAFGTAFDINADENPLGSQPALPGKPGCVFDLVPVAHAFGFYWGGHFKSRRDGMHFEIARILSDAQVTKALGKF
jgi:hypothetical protein